MFSLLVFKYKCIYSMCVYAVRLQSYLVCFCVFVGAIVNIFKYLSKILATVEKINDQKYYVSNRY